MPELPEVETMRRGIQSTVGRIVAAAVRTRCNKKPISLRPTIETINRRVRGRTIRATDRLGKRVILVLDDEQRLVFEPRMTGLVSLGEPPNLEHLRFELQFQSKSHPRLCYWDRRGLGSVRLLRPREFAVYCRNLKLGPDALEIGSSELQARLGRRKTAIKVALLDQSAVAGIGNLYAAEILHRAKIHPEMPCHRLSADDWRTIHSATRHVLFSAIRSEGSTLSDGTYRNAQNQPGQFQNRHRVYDREGERCPTCGRESIVRIVQAQRATFFCSRCQSRKPRSKLSR